MRLIGIQRRSGNFGEGEDFISRVENLIPYRAVVCTLIYT
jgi:hypothetical protein